MVECITSEVVQECHGILYLGVIPRVGAVDIGRVDLRPYGVQEAPAEGGSSMSGTPEKWQWWRELRVEIVKTILAALRALMAVGCFILQLVRWGGGDPS